MGFVMLLISSDVSRCVFAVCLKRSYVLSALFLMFCGCLLMSVLCLYAVSLLCSCILEVLCLECSLRFMRFDIRAHMLGFLLVRTKHKARQCFWQNLGGEKKGTPEKGVIKR